MYISELIKTLQEEFGIHGDKEVMFFEDTILIRLNEDDPESDLIIAYDDDEDNDQDENT